MHQLIVGLLYRRLFAFVQANYPGAEVLVAPIPVRLFAREYREPDVIFRSAEHVRQDPGAYPHTADLVIEVVSGSKADRERDLIDKRHDYAQASIPEYWMVDPQDKVVIVLRLEGNEYVEHGRFVSGDTATSALLPGFSLLVADVWAAAN
jgi:Uma2 family endonuclease